MGQIGRWLNTITASIIALALGLPFVRARTLSARLFPGIAPRIPPCLMYCGETDCMLALCGTYGRGCKSHYLLPVRKAG
jgi:hypothetical protein